MKINPVILIGGSVTRLWPMSRANFPKQFNKFSGEHSLFQQTLLRLNNLPNIGKIYLVVGESNYFLCLDQLREVGIENVVIIVEPIGKNTLPAIAVAANYIQHDLMLVLPSDHHIKDTEKFIATVTQAAEYARDKIILFGSCAEGSDTLHSDIDLLVITKDKININRAVQKIRLSRPVSWVIKTPQEYVVLNNKEKVFAREIGRGIVLWETHEIFGV